MPGHCANKLNTSCEETDILSTFKVGHCQIFPPAKKQEKNLKTILLFLDNLQGGGSFLLIA